MQTESRLYQTRKPRVKKAAVCPEVSHLVGGCAALSRQTHGPQVKCKVIRQASHSEILDFVLLRGCSQFSQRKPKGKHDCRR